MAFIEQTGDTYASSKFAKVLAVGEAKQGKSCYLIASALGVLPWQKQGGIVDKPEHLHVLAFDSNALGGVQRFLKDTCGAGPDALKFRVYNLQDSFRRTSDSDTDYDMGFYNDVVGALGRIQQRVKEAKGVHVVLVSSLTGLAQGIERGVVGPPKSEGYADRNKWQLIKHQLTELRNYAQLDDWHTIWEAHLDTAGGGGGKQDAAPKQTIHVSGSAGRSWGYNVEQVFRIRRQFGDKYEKTSCEKTYLDTQASLEFLIGGRNFTEALAAKEYDPTLAFEKLGLVVGKWNKK